MNEPIHVQLEGSVDYVAALDALCGLATRSLCFFEKDFEGTGFNSEARYETLRAFLLANRMNTLQMLAHDTRPLARDCPRLLMLLRQFGHNMHVYQTPKHLQHITEPFAVADESHYVRRFHFDDARGVFVRDDPVGARVLKARFSELWGVSKPAVSGVVLGL